MKYVSLSNCCKIKQCDLKTHLHILHFVDVCFVGTTDAAPPLWSFRLRTQEVLGILLQYAHAHSYMVDITGLLQNITHYLLYL